MRRLLPLAIAALLATIPGPAAANGVPAGPSAFEQYLVELINRARRDPAAEAVRMKINDPNLTHDPQEALAVVHEVTDMCRWFLSDVFANFSAIPSAAAGRLDSLGRDAWERLALAVADWGKSEGVGTVSGSEVTRATVDSIYAQFLKSSADRGHLFDPDWTNVGLAVAAGKLGSAPTVLCERYYFGVDSGSPYYGYFITGTVFHDWLKADGFYTPYEGMAGVTVTATRASPFAQRSATTWAAGGYAVQLPPGDAAGTWTLSATGGPIGAATYTYPTPIVFTDRNVWASISAVGSLPSVPTTFDFVSGACKAAKAGGWTLSVKKCVFNPYFEALTDADLSGLAVTVDGVPFLASPLPAKLTRNADGGIVKLTLTDAAKNKLVIDMAKRTVALTVKNLPGLDPLDGDLSIGLSIPRADALVVVTPTVAGTKIVLPATAGTLTLK